MKLKYLFLFLSFSVYINSQVIRETLSPLANPNFIMQEKNPDNYLDSLKKQFSIEEQCVVDVTLRLSESVFALYPIMGNAEGDVYEINSSFTQQYLERNLFGSGSRLDCTLFCASSTDQTAFYLDPDWKRILFARQVNSTYSEIKKFNGTSLVVFENPVAIDVNEFREIYVADSQAKKIYKLTYNTNNTITASSSPVFINSQYLNKPTDLDYSNNETPNNRADDYIIVCDAGRRSILIFNTSGTLLNEFFGYYRCGEYVPFSNPTRITTSYHVSNSFVLIDEGTKSIIHCIIMSDKLNMHYENKLPANSIPVDIGIDGTENIIVVDKGLQMLHVFNSFTNYVCSYTGPSSYFFTNPETVTNFSFSAHPGYIKLELFSTDSWSNSRGIKKFVPGADALNMVDIETTMGHEIRPYFTNRQSIRVQIQDYTVNSIIYDSGIWTDNWPGYGLFHYEGQLIPEHTYKWIVSYKPYYDSYYGNYAVGWKSKETPIPTLLRPIISSITQNPIPIYKGTYGYVYVNLSQGNGDLTYNWISTNQPSYVSIVPEGYRCKIIYHNTESIPPVDAPTWIFGCTVSNAPGAGWSDTKYFVPSLNSDPNGCPTLAFEQNGNLVSENTLLITSISNPDKDVTDYYLINTPLVPTNNKINLTIHEPQTEHTWFDNVSLLETRANPDETIVVNDEGQVINYKGVLPARILLNGETDITQNLLVLDSLSVELNPGDKLTISRNATEGDGDVVINGEEGIPISKRIPAMLMNVITQKQSVENEKEIITESTPFTNFFLRPNKSTISKKLRNLPTGTIEITVNKKLTLDYFVFVTDLRTARTRTLPLVSAVHNVNGDIKSKLSGIDQNYSEMYPAERIDLSFSTTTNSGNIAYILKTVGRYETDTTFLNKQNNLVKLNEQPIIPTENKLYDNYPNPFNPSTVIKYSLKNDGRVTLIIYNILGEEVNTLVNEIKAAGNYEVEFNASELSSGIYIYAIRSGDFVKSKKMILLK